MKNFLILSLMFLFLSCNSKWDKSNLMGNWDTVEWIKLDTGEALENSMKFSFEESDRYEVDYGSQKELGKFWIAGEYLHTVEDGQSEKKVRITKLTSDTMIFEMNRAGYLEKLTLIKE